ncbi:MAG: 5-oxoprolinase subunit PxpB [Gluconobacter potus]|uniref:5-oxoprolinase subunit PxpB n=1 Tax=Gluconobacter potus TaxID=2724927 RepID=A0ABR9YQH2_9PROT|nr:MULTISPECIES: 5-oxoprolinase subunit PxpB [Gluconobacter]MBF0865843.1 5-oxoprolinase subunit PxpB [Gluconobacter sp. R71656]MBF0868945.1 5-oxoprolinase subunit PxpB [Gluconobacter sp. R75628]MBF0874929.1 5-oxoprolinase subunit PxpB [Gluconobacter sp. R75629]MBF0883858.1 5-oxoprolinase subunit PxpB [Gluconobacter potus]
MTRIHMAGAGGLLLDAADGAFNDMTQRRIWATSRELNVRADIVQTIPGVNNLLVMFDAVETDPATMETLLRDVWTQASADEIPTREIVVPVIYGGTFGEDLALVARFANLTEEETIEVHVAGRYSVAAIGAMAGFVYLTGLDSRLAVPRRDSPRLRVEKGAVVIGGGHAGMMPCTSPSGWHILGRTDLCLFDAFRPEPGLLRLGDTVRFVRAS